MKKPVTTFLILNLTLLFSCISCNIAPGSYPYAERYEINCSESDLILAVEKFKIDNPEFNLPVKTQLKDGRRDDNDHWYHVYFFYEKENVIFKTWIRRNGEKSTVLAFVAINDGLILGNWMYINKDFSKGENKIQKEKFERLIFEEVKKRIQRE
jgi:hypothetical protein